MKNPSCLKKGNNAYAISRCGPPGAVQLPAFQGDPSTSFCFSLSSKREREIPSKLDATPRFYIKSSTSQADAVSVRFGVGYGSGISHRIEFPNPDPPLLSLEGDPSGIRFGVLKKVQP